MGGIRDRLRGRWRITKTGTWDSDYLDLVESAFIAFDHPDIGSAFSFGVVTASLDCAYGRTGVKFRFEDSDEGTPVWGDGWARMDGPDAIHGVIAFHSGDETTFLARRW